MRTVSNSCNPFSWHAMIRTGVCAAMLGGVMAFGLAQAPAAQTPVTPAAPRKAFHSYRHRDKAKARTAAPVIAAPVTPPAPKLPPWPANEKPTPAVVTWDSQGLRIQAANASLKQILDDVATATGAKVEGLSLDERVYGSYGPGRAVDVLNQLLQGSKYNVLLVQNQGEQSLREIVLSSRSAGFAAPAINRPVKAGSDDDDDDDDADEKPIAPPRPMPTRNAAPPNAPRP